MSDVGTSDVVDVDNSSLSDDVWYYDEWLDPFEVTSSCLAILAYIPTITLIIILSRHCFTKGFKKSFQKLFFILMMNDLLCVFMQMVTLRLPWWGVFGVFGSFAHGFIPTFMIYQLFACRYVQVFGCAFLALNRACSIRLPTTYEKFWNGNFIYIIFLLFLFTQICALQIFLGKGTFFYQFAPAAFVMQPVENEKGIQFVAVAIAVILITFSINLYSTIHLYRHLKKVKYSRSDIRSFYMTLITFVCQLVATVTEYFVQYGHGDLQYWSMQISAPINDLNSLLPIYMLIFVSHEYRAIIFPKQTATIDVMISSVASGKTSSIQKNN